MTLLQVNIKLNVWICLNFFWPNIDYLTFGDLNIIIYILGLDWL